MAVSLTSLTFLILNINAALDTGRYDEVSIADVHLEIERGSVLRFLERTCGEDIDLSLFLSPSRDRDFEPWYENKLQEIYGGYAGQERRKWGVEDRGLCLLIAWTNEIIQQRDGIEFVRASDRLVPIDHNSMTYRDVDAKLSELIEIVQQMNDFPEFADKEQTLGELKAGKTLLSAAKVRLDAISAVLVTSLKYLATTFLDQAVGILAMAALVALAALLGVHL